MPLSRYYLELRQLHISCAALSLSLFVLRGYWMLYAPERLQQHWVRIMPHVVDTLLLASAVALTTVIHQYPLRNGWLTAKLLALIVYIVLGSIALKRGRTRISRAWAFFAALAVFGFIVSVALRHDYRF